MSQMARPRMCRVLNVGTSIGVGLVVLGFGGVAIATPQLTNVAPSVTHADGTITVTGSGFGLSGAAVWFECPDHGADAIAVNHISDYYAGRTLTQTTTTITVVVPYFASSGRLYVTDASFVLSKYLLDYEMQWAALLPGRLSPSTANLHWNLDSLGKL